MSLPSTEFIFKILKMHLKTPLNEEICTKIDILFNNEKSMFNENIISDIGLIEMFVNNDNSVLETSV